MRQTVRGRTLRAAEAAAYRAPFPSAAYHTGVLVFPRLVPVRLGHPGAYDNRIATDALRSLELPVLLPGADGDPIMGYWEGHLRDIFRNVGAPLTIARAGRCLQGGRRPRDRCAYWLVNEIDTVSPYKYFFSFSAGGLCQKFKIESKINGFGVLNPNKFLSKPTSWAKLLRESVGVRTHRRARP
jgi:hypothetical protein